MEITTVTKEIKRPVEVFCCYAREDQPYVKELIKHLMPLQREGLITLWADTNINAGAEWEKEIHQHLTTSHIILLLVSPDFIASHYCYGIEMTYSMERHRRGEAQVIPISLRPVDWKNTPFAKLQALPRDAHPIVSSKSPFQDEGFAEVAGGIREVVEAFLAKKEQRDPKEDIPLPNQSKFHPQHKIIDHPPVEDGAKVERLAKRALKLSHGRRALLIVLLLLTLSGGTYAYRTLGGSHIQATPPPSPPKGVTVDWG